jgi:hypothetical protein
MNDSYPRRPATAVAAAPSKPTLLMAIVAPFAAIALLATPLAFEALKHLFGG